MNICRIIKRQRGAVAAGYLTALLALPPPAFPASPVWQVSGAGLADARISTVAVDPTHPHLLYAGSAHTVYQSADGGAHWRPCFRAPAQAEVTSLAVDPFESRHVTAATTHGLYASRDAGQSWTRAFRASGTGESDCRIILFHPERRDQLFAGTAGGLFVSTDGGRQWQEVAGRLSDRVVHQLAFEPRTPTRLYALTDQGLFVSSADYQSWDRVFGTGPAEGSADETSEAPEEAPEDSPAAGTWTALAIDPQPPHTMYVGGSMGLFQSQDGGATWQRTAQIGLGTPAIRHLILRAHSPTTAYAATSEGVARYRPQEARWEPLYQGLPTRAVRYLAATDTQVFAATDQGLYSLDLTEEQLAEGNWPSAREILADFAAEPTITQVQDAAIHYAEVEPDKIRRWRRQASLKALLPTFKFGYDRNRDTYTTSSGTTTNPAFDRIIQATDPSRSFDLSFDWDLGDLIWNNDQTSIDTRSKLMVQLRSDILDEVTRAYFERRRLQVELLTDPPKNPKQQLEKELRLQELTAMIDGMTGGWFAKHIDFDRRIP